MLTPEERTAVGTIMTPLRIIISALMAGLLGYAIIAIVQSGAPAAQDSILAPLAAGMAAVGALAAIAVPRVIAGQERQQIVEGTASVPSAPGALNAAGDAGKLLMGYQTRRIIAGALLEGPGFFNAFVYQQERVPYTLGVLAALLLGLAMLFPVRASVERWLESELRTVRELRELRG